jgi:hypothetical protein
MFSLTRSMSSFTAKALSSRIGSSIGKPSEGSEFHRPPSSIDLSMQKAANQSFALTKLPPALLGGKALPAPAIKPKTAEPSYGVDWFVKEGFKKAQAPSRQFYSEDFSRKIDTSRKAFADKRTEAAGGAGGGAYFTLDESKKPQKIGLFKIDETHRGAKLATIQFFNTIGGQRAFLRSNHIESKAEVASSILERSIKYELGDNSFFTPQVSLQKFNGINGGLQEFLPGHEDKTAWLAKKSYTKKEHEIFQEFALLDYAMGNLDRHLENWLINVDHNGELVNIRAIDNANTMPEVKPASHYILPPPKNQFIWAKEKIANGVCEPNIRAKAQKMFSSKAANQAILDIDRNVPGFLNDKMKANLKDRFQVLHTLTQKEDFKVSDLHNYRDGRL